MRTAPSEFALGTVLSDFLIALFERVVVISTQVEFLFASLSKFTSTPHSNGGAGMASLAAKYTINSFSQCQEQEAKSRTCVRSGKCRAPWMYTHAKGRHMNHFHVLANSLGASGLGAGASGLGPGASGLGPGVSGLGPGVSDEAEWVPGKWMQEVQRQFEELSTEEQERLRNEARSTRELAKRTPSLLDEALHEDNDDKIQGPWGLATCTGLAFPLRLSVIREALQGTNISSLAGAWRQLHVSSTKPLEGFPDKVVLPDVCLGGCTSDLLQLGGDFKPEVQRLWCHLQFACRYGPKTKRPDYRFEV